jgi:hypothetical protein
LSARPLFCSILIALSLGLILPTVAAPIPDSERIETEVEALLGRANTEAAAGQWQSAIADAKTAIGRQTKSSGEVDYRVAHRLLSLTLRLAQDGHFNDAEMLQKLAIEKHKGLFGAVSIVTDRQQSQLFQLYCRQEKFEQAFAVLDQITNHDPRPLEFDSYPASTAEEVVASEASYLERQGKSPMAIKILKRLLDSSRKYYPSDHYRIALLLEQMADVERDSDEATAVADYRAALAIQELYGDWQRCRRIRHYLAETLLKQGKVNEANKLKAENTKPDSQTLWSANQRFNSLQQVYPTYLRARQLEPYSPRTRQAVEQLLDLCVKNKAWPKLAVLASDAIKIQEHSSCKRSIGCTVTTTPSIQRRRYYKLAVEADIAIGDKSTAQALVRRAEQFNGLSQSQSQAKSVEDAIFLAQLNVLIEDRKTASLYAKQAQSLLPGDAPKYLAMGNYLAVADLWKSIGDQEEHKRASQAANVYFAKIREDDNRKQAQDNVIADLPPLEAQPGSATFPAPALVADNYTFNYAALASHSLILENGARLVSPNFMPGGMPNNCFAASFGQLKSAQTIHSTTALPSSAQSDSPRKLQFVVTNTDSLNIHMAAVNRLADAARGVGAGTGGMFSFPSTKGVLPPVQALPFKAVVVPSALSPLGTVIGDRVLEPGSYSAVRINTSSLILPATGATKIFIDANSSGIVFHAKDIAFINAVRDMPMWLGSSNRFELWYGGTGTIRLDDKTWFNGVIYAPNARVEMEGHVNFYGAIVAREVWASGPVAIYQNQMLQRW